MAGSRIKGITIELDANTVKLTDSLKKVDSSLKETQIKLKDVNRLLKLDPSNVNLLRQKHDLLTKSVKDTKDRLTELKKAQDQLKNSKDTTEAAQEAQRNLQNEIFETEQKLKSLNSQLKNPELDAFSQKTAKAAEATKKLSAAAAGAAAALLGNAYNAAKTADDINTLSKQYGVSVEEIQKMNYAQDRIDVSTEAMLSSYAKLTKQIGKGSDAFEELGVAITDDEGNFRSTNEVWYETLEALSKIENETERDVKAQELFGKSAAELAGIIDDGGQALKDLGEEAENTGLILSGDALASANEFNDSIDKLKATASQAFLKAGAALAEDLVPALEQLVEWVSKGVEWFASLDGTTQTVILSVLGLVAAISPVLGLISTITGAAAALNIAVLPLIGTIAAVVAGIALLISIGVALYRNWDTIKEKTVQMGETLKREWNTAKENISKAVTDIKDKVKKTWDDMISSITEKLNAAFDTVKGIWDKITGIFSKKVEGDVEIRETTVRTTYTQQNPAGTTGYASAYDNPVLFTKPTVLPTINGMKRFGDGNGSELVVGTDKLMSMIQQASGAGNVTVNVTLQGDAAKIFRVVRTENQKFKGSTGRSAFDY